MPGMTGMTEVERWNHLRNDVYQIWIDSPGLTIIETISLLRKRRLVDRPQAGIIEALTQMKEEFDAMPTRPRDSIDDLDRDNTPIGSNPFMEE